MDYVIIWLLFGVVAMIIANAKGRSGSSGLILGGILGPFSLVVALLPKTAEVGRERVQEGGARDEFKRCPFCAEVILRESVKYRFCSSEPPVHATAPPPTQSSGIGYALGKTLGAGLVERAPDAERTRLGRIIGTYLLLGVEQLSCPCGRFEVRWSLVLGRQ